MTEANGANGGLSAKEVKSLIRKAEKGDRKVLPALRKLLDTHPGLTDYYGSVADAARHELVKGIGGEKNLAVQEVYARKLDAMGQELERLLVERIVICSLHLYYAETIYVQNMGDFTLGQADFHQRRITKVHNHYLSTIRTLAQVRRLGVPAVQVNIGDQQVNVAP